MQYVQYWTMFMWFSSLFLHMSSFGQNVAMCILLQFLWNFETRLLPNINEDFCLYSLYMMCSKNRGKDFFYCLSLYILSSTHRACKSYTCIYTRQRQTVWTQKYKEKLINDKYICYISMILCNLWVQCL